MINISQVPFEFFFLWVHWVLHVTMKANSGYTEARWDTRIFLRGTGVQIFGAGAVGHSGDLNNFYACALALKAIFTLARWA